MEEALNSLFNKYLDNKCSTSEIRILLNHFQVPESGNSLKEAILNELQKRDEPDRRTSDINERLEKIYSRIQKQVQPEKYRPVSVRKIVWYRMAAAAIILLVTGLGLFYYNTHDTNTDLQFAVNKNHIHPGRNQAILTLANGKKISLGSMAKGQVVVQPGMRITKTADGQLVYQANNSFPHQGSTAFNTIEAPAGGQWQIILPDRSHVWLNARSSITYPTSFSGRERKVSLTGEAYFEVAHNSSMPFKVVTGDHTVEVLGTHFNVMAYANDKVVKTTLLQGSVKVSINGKTRLLQPGEQSIGNQIDIKISDKVDLEEVTAWKNGYFKFNDNIETIMSKVARWYDVQIIYDGKPDPNHTYEGEISRSRNLAEILNIMGYTGKIHFSIDGRRIIVKK